MFPAAVVVVYVQRCPLKVTMIPSPFLGIGSIALNAPEVAVLVLPTRLTLTPSGPVSPLLPV